MIGQHWPAVTLNAASIQRCLNSVGQTNYSQKEEGGGGHSTGRRQTGVHKDRQGCIYFSGRGAYISQVGVHKGRQGFIYFSGRGAYISQAGVHKGRQGFIYFPGRGAYISQAGVNKGRQGFIYFSGWGAYISQAGVHIFQDRKGCIYFSIPTFLPTVCQGELSHH